MTGRPAPACPVRKGDLAVIEVTRRSVDAHGFHPASTTKIVIATVAQATRDGWARKVTWGHRTEWVPVPSDDGPDLRRGLFSPVRLIAVVPLSSLTDPRRVVAVTEGREYDDIGAVRSVLRPYRKAS